MTHNLDWKDIESLFESLGTVERSQNGNLKVTLSGTTQVFQSPNSGDNATEEEIMQIRHFLNESGAVKNKRPESDFLVVIDHNQARIYSTEVKGTVPIRVTPHDLGGQKGHVHSSHDFRDRSEKPDSNAYFGAIAKQLSPADRILVFGSGVGSSSAMDIFVSWLKNNNKPLSERIFRTVQIDQSHMTENELLALARKAYAD